MMDPGTTRLALFLPSLDGGGAERAFINLARSFASEGYAVDLVVARSTPAVLHVPAAPRLRTVRLGKARVAGSVPALAGYLRRARPAAIISAMSHANIAAILARRLAGTSTRVVVTEHLPPTFLANDRREQLNRVMPSLMRLFYPHADEIVSVSDSLGDDLAAAADLPRHSIRTIYNPIPVEELHAQAAEPLCCEWLDADDAPLILGIGRLTDQKDFANLIEAVARVRVVRACRLLIIGEGEERHALEALIGERGLAEAVRMPGFSANPYRYFKWARVFALSSKAEGLPLVLIEALALGVPIVATDCRSGPREILRGGKLGRLVAPGDPAALSDGLLAALTDHREPAGDACAEYRPGRIVHQYAGLLGID